MNRPFLCLALLAALCGCHADLDWREFRSDEGRFSVWFPGVPALESRQLSGRGDPVAMRQWTAKSRSTVFAAGYADFARLDRGTLDEISVALVRNIGGTAVRQRELEIAGAKGTETIAEGYAGSARLSLRLRLYARGNRLYQIAVLGTPDDFPEDGLETFFDSFRLGPPP
jgi:hypothetical protein